MNIINDISNSMRDKIIYQLFIDDFQIVATEIIQRKLTPEELETIATKLADQIDWYNSISVVIRENIK